MKLRVLAGAAAALILSVATASAETLFIRTLNGETVPVEIALSDSVETLKGAVEDATGVPSGQQRLIFAGRQIEDGHMLSDYNLRNENTIHLVVRPAAQ